MSRKLPPIYLGTIGTHMPQALLDEVERSRKTVVHEMLKEDHQRWIDTMQKAAVEATVNELVNIDSLAQLVENPLESTEYRSRYGAYMRRFGEMPRFKNYPRAFGTHIPFDGSPLGRGFGEIEGLRFYPETYPGGKMGYAFHMRIVGTMQILFPGEVIPRLVYVKYLPNADVSFVKVKHKKEFVRAPSHYIYDVQNGVSLSTYQLELIRRLKNDEFAPLVEAAMRNGYHVPYGSHNEWLHLDLSVNPLPKSVRNYYTITNKHNRPRWVKIPYNVFTTNYIFGKRNPFASKRPISSGWCNFGAYCHPSREDIFEEALGELHNAQIDLSYPIVRIW